MDEPRRWLVTLRDARDDLVYAGVHPGRSAPAALALARRASKDIRLDQVRRLRVEEIIGVRL